MISILLAGIGAGLMLTLAVNLNPLPEVAWPLSWVLVGVGLVGAGREENRDASR